MQSQNDVLRIFSRGLYLLKVGVFTRESVGGGGPGFPQGGARKVAKLHRGWTGEWEEEEEEEQKDE